MKLFKHADKRIVSSGLAIALGATVMYTVLGSYATIWAEIKGVLGYLNPVIWGLILAYVMRPFAAFVERLLPKKFSQKAKAHIGGVCALILLIVLIVVFMYLLLPQLISSVTGFMNHFDEYLESLKKTLREYLEHIQLVEIDVDKTIGTSSELLKTLAKWMSGNIDIIMNAIVQLSSRFVNFIIVITMATYALLDRANLRTGSVKLEKALMGEARTEKVNTVIKRGDMLMMRFLSSNLMDALIIGVVNFIFLGLVSAPYQLIMAVMLGITNFIPTFGPIIGGIAGAIIVLLTKPTLLFGFILFTVVLQQIDGNVIKPLLFGDSTGLSPFWVLVAIVVGGNMFGITGMIMGVPVVALISSLIKEYVARKNGEPLTNSTIPEKRRFFPIRKKKKDA
ncbi:MAG: AI-2E family transporter [Clostridia bacterium]|nr:AI-2E family transporter [Clostridia bacterium]MBR5986680.1 AI-2E family transporter [Clostridia bacterium]MBR6009425.1 AI-2E family transporter [Clostridia bacterium]MBR6498526.1 AI-2E family transporter [Clostridia bacterium]